MKPGATSGLLAIVLLLSACGTPSPPKEREAAGGTTPATASAALPADEPVVLVEGPSRLAAPGEPELTWAELDRRGDEHLKAGRFDEAIADFDTAIALRPELEPHHWRRGIAHYYAGRYADGAAQFELHRTVNGNDVENAAWHFLCVARMDGVEAARARLLPVEPDARVPMMERRGWSPPARGRFSRPARLPRGQSWVPNTAPGRRGDGGTAPPLPPRRLPRDVQACETLRP